MSNFVEACAITSSQMHLRYCPVCHSRFADAIEILANLHPLGNPEIVNKMIMYMFGKKEPGLCQTILKDGVLFQNSLKRTSAPPPCPLPRAALPPPEHTVPPSRCPGRLTETGMESFSEKLKKHTDFQND